MSVIYRNDEVMKQLQDKIVKLMQESKDAEDTISANGKLINDLKAQVN